MIILDLMQVMVLDENKNRIGKRTSIDTLSFEMWIPQMLPWWPSSSVSVALLTLKEIEILFGS